MMPDDPIGPVAPLGAEARALLDAARDELAPDPAAIRRMRGKIEIAAGGLALGVKLAIVAMIATVAAGAGVALQRRAEVAEAPRIELASPSEAQVQVAVREVVVPPPSDDELIVIEPNAPVRPTARKPAAGAARVAVREPITLAREVELLDQAMAGLRGGDPDAALRAVQLHATETAGHGQLAEDAAAIEIEARCALHDPSTAARLEAFDARYPRSAQRSRLASRCR